MTTYFGFSAQLSMFIDELRMSFTSVRKLFFNVLLLGVLSSLLLFLLSNVFAKVIQALFQLVVRS